MLDLQQVEQLLDDVRSAEDGESTNASLNELLRICHEHFRGVARRLLNARFSDLRDRGIETDCVVNGVLLDRVYGTLEKDLKNLKTPIYADAGSFLAALAHRMEWVLLDAVRGRDKGGRPPWQDTNRPNPAGVPKVDLKLAGEAEKEFASEAEQEFVREGVKDAIDQLSERDQDIIRMFYLELMRRKEIAERFDLTERQVGRLLRRAREHFETVYTP
jgi:RNA polymerase sigma factor (sigma-70 family)